MELGEINRLDYTIHSCSSVSNKYYPQNILVDAPQDPSSRWAGHYQPAAATTSAAATVASSSGAPAASSSGGGWIVLELEKPALLRQVHFGKFHRQHPCTLKEFALLAGSTLETLKPVRQGVLRADPKAERVDIAWRETDEAGGMPRVVRFVKILPISAQGANYNVSIWHVALFGHSDERVVAGLLDEWTRANKMRTMRSILSHLRRTRNPLFPALLDSTPGVTLEHPLLSDLHAQFVAPRTPSWQAAEKTVHDLADAGLFDAYLRAGKKTSRWSRRPSLGQGRGGHQMVEYPPGERFWVFGGFDGREDHADLHYWDVGSENWVAREREVGEPWPERRSCHKWTVCGSAGWMLGRYVDDPPPTVVESSAAPEPVTAPAPAPPVTRPHPDVALTYSPVGVRPLVVYDEIPYHSLNTPAASTTPTTTPNQAQHQQSSVVSTSLEQEKNELWRFDFAADGGRGRWELVCADNKSKGGPSLVYDHQMVVDEVGRALYVYGGTDPAGELSGMFRYDIRRGQWAELFGDNHMGLQSRTGHSMLWNAAKREIYIFGGLRSPSYLSDFWTVSLLDPERPIVNRLTADYSKAGLGPLPAFTQRAVLDPSRDEIVVLSGLMKEPSVQAATTVPLDGSSAAVAATSGSGTGAISGIVKSELWAFSLALKKWEKIEEQVGDESAVEPGAMDVDDDGETSIRPTPRFAHQFLYSPASNSYLLMGGNPGAASSSTPLLGTEVRLGDCWELKVERPKVKDVVRRILLALRQRQFIELCGSNGPLAALTFLQTSLHAVVNHKDAHESELFRSLLAHILRAPQIEDGRPSTFVHLDAAPDDATFAARTAVFRQICADFVLDRRMKQPEEELSDLVDGRVALEI